MQSAARRPRRPGDARHDPAAVDESEVLDDHRLARADGRASPLPVLCQDALLLRARTECPKCGERTAAFALLGLPEFETEGGAVMLRRIAALPPEVDKAARAFAGQLWRIDQSRVVKGSHWHSHCERCGARLPEVHLHGPLGPFRPRLYRDRVAIKAKRLTGPFVFDGASAALNPAMLDWLAWFREREDRQQAADRPRRAPLRARARR
jgi:ribosomal protein S27AE